MVAWWGLDAAPKLNISEHAMTKDKFADKIVGTIDSDLKLLSSVSAMAWHNDKLLIRAMPDDPNEFTSAVEEFMDKLRDAANEVPFKARYQFIRLNDRPGVVFELQPEVELAADNPA